MKKEDKVKITYKVAEDASGEESQRRVSRAYEVLFNATLKDWKRKRK